MARHTARGWGQPWSGAPEDLVQLTAQGQQIVRSAAGEGHKCVITLCFRHRRESHYDSPEEFLASFSLSDISDLKSVMILYGESPENSLAATAHLVSGWWQRPFITVFCDDPALADGLARRLAHMFPGRRRTWQGLRRPGEVPRLTRWRIGSRRLVIGAITVAGTVAVTIFVTKLLG